MKWSWPRRSRGRGSGSAASTATVSAVLTDEVVQLRAWREQLLSPVVVADTFNMQTPGDKDRLALRVWLGGFEESLAAVRAANPALMQVLEAQISSAYDTDGRAREDHATRKARLVDGVLCIILRAATQFNVPLLCAALSILGRGHCVADGFHESVRVSSFLVLTETWAAQFMVHARAFRPPPPYEVLEGVAAAVFDNLTMRVDYGSYVVNGEGGLLMHMTNWLYTRVPRHLAPPGFNAEQIFRAGTRRALAGGRGGGRPLSHAAVQALHEHLERGILGLERRLLLGQRYLQVDVGLHVFKLTLERRDTCEKRCLLRLVGLQLRLELRIFCAREKAGARQEKMRIGDASVRRAQGVHLARGLACVRWPPRPSWAPHPSACWWSRVGARAVFCGRAPRRRRCRRRRCGRASPCRRQSSWSSRLARKGAHSC